MRVALWSLAVIAISISMAQAQRQELTVVESIYFTSFADDSVHPNVTFRKSNGKEAIVKTVESPRGIQLLGRFGGGDVVTLSLNDLPRHEKLVIDVGFHIIGSWDGIQDDDRFVMRIDGKPVFDHTFSNTIYSQSYPGDKDGKKIDFPARTGARNSNMLAYKFVEPGVYDGEMDASYVNEFVVEHTAEDAVLEITAVLKDVRKGIENESWGLEHIKVTAVGPPPPASLFPAPVLVRKPDWDEEVVEYRGKDFRAVAGYDQSADLPGIMKGSAWENKAHSTVMKTRYMRCGEICLFYTYNIYNDGWVNVWVNQEMGGEALWSTQIDQTELDTIRSCVVKCMGVGDGSPMVEYKAEDSDEHPDLPHAELLIRSYGLERMVNINGGEPEEFKEAMGTVLRILARHGWEPSPYSWD